MHALEGDEVAEHREVPARDEDLQLHLLADLS
jgi:hypothetical protein